MTASGTAADLRPATRQPFDLGVSSRTQLLSVAAFVGLSLTFAAIAFVAGTPAPLMPFALVVAPTMIAIAYAWREGHGAVRRLLRSLTIRPNRARWYLVLLLPLIWALAAVGIAVILGEPSAGLFDRLVPAILIVPLVVLLPAFMEELAWRGFVLPRLMSVMSPLQAALILAVPWTLIHVILFLPGQQYDILAIWPMVLSIFAYSIVLTWVYVGTGGSVLLTALLHAGLNGVAPLMAGVDADASWAIRNILAAGIALGLIALGAFRPMWSRVPSADAEMATSPDPRLGTRP
jgi:membrane protease YdiL (CAAX protease family)